MIFSVTRRVEIPVTIRYVESTGEYAEGLYVYVGEWNWHGPLDDVATARIKQRESEQALADAWQDIIVDGQEHNHSHFNYATVVRQAFEGQPIVKPPFSLHP